MGQQFSDAARSELTAGILAGDTTFTLADGSRFPDANAGTSPVSDANLWFKAVLQDETGFEIVYVRTHAVATTPDTLSNVLRGQEGTTARAFAADSVVGLRPLAADMDTAINGRQPLLVSGSNIRTVGGVSLLGPGDIPVGGSVNVAYTWNSDGTLATATSSGVTSSYAWHADGRLNTVSTPTQVATYNWNAINPQQLDGVTVTGV